MASEVLRAEMSARELIAEERIERQLLSVDNREQEIRLTLIRHFSRLNMSADRVGKETKLRSVCSSSDITSLSVVVGRRVFSGEAGRKTSVHRAVEELGELCEGHLSDLLKTETSLFGSRGDGGSHEIT